MARAGNSERRSWRWLAVACATIAAQVAAASSIIWTGTLSRAPAADEGIVLVETAAGRSARLRVLSTAPSRPPTLPVGPDLLARADIRAFGRDERCEVSRDAGSVRVVCAAGRSVAGIVIGFGDATPPGAANTLLLVESEGDGFAGEFVRPGADADDPQPLGPGVRLPVRYGAAVLVIAAPKAGGTLILRALSLTAAAPVAFDAPSAWAWSSALWRRDPDGLIRQAAGRGIRKLYVSIPIGREVEQPGQLARFIRAGARAGVAIVAVEGDPDMVMPAGRVEAVRRAAALAAYQVSAPTDARLAGLQLDIEPYIRPGWRGSRTAFDAWSGTVRDIAAAFGTPVELVLPFWIAEHDAGADFLDATRRSLTGIVAMAYRSDGGRLATVAEPLLSWGAQRGAPVRIALENGILTDESEQLFVPAATGTLALREDLTLSLHSKVERIDGAVMFFGGARTPIRAKALSFMGDEAEMVATARTAAPAFAAWPSFAGFAFHGIAWKN